MTIDLKQYLSERGQNFNDLRILARIKKNEVVRVCRVNERTVRRWRCHDTYPAWAYKLMGYHAGFFIWDGWDGWYIEDGLIYPPQYKHGFTPNDVAMMGFMRAELNSYRPHYEHYKK